MRPCYTCPPVRILGAILKPIVPVILCGGFGMRLWPLSRRLHPKPLLALEGETSLLRQTIARVTGEDFAAPVIVCNGEHRLAVERELEAAGIDARLVLEPASRSTAPAAAAAALLAARDDPDAIMLVLPSDHLIANASPLPAALRLREAGRLAADGLVVAFGVRAEAADAGYGYIVKGEPLAGAFRIRRFVEKPDVKTAEGLIASGEVLWNSGIFCASAGVFLNALARHEPEIARAAERAVAGARREGRAVVLDGAAFAQCPTQSIDCGIMERAPDAAVIPADLSLADAGSWNSIWRAGARDERGNSLRGDVIACNTRNSYIHSTGPLVAAADVENLAIVATTDAVLVARRDADMRALVEDVQQRREELVAAHPLVSRPWGTFESLARGAGFQVKRIIVKPGARISLQLHHRRAEHWVVVRGAARVTCGERQFVLRAGESTFIAMETRHRVENPGSEPLEFIEVQLGDYLGEDDIVRFADDYGRVS